MILFDNMHIKDYVYSIIVSRIKALWGKTNCKYQQVVQPKAGAVAAKPTATATASC